MNIYSLEEKFRVLNHEALADELSSLLAEFRASGAPVSIYIPLCILRTLIF